MKKILCLMLAVLLVSTAFVGCGKKEENKQQNTQPSVETTTGVTEEQTTQSSQMEETEGSGYRVETLKLAGGTDWGAPNPFLNMSRGPGQAKMRLVFGSLLEKNEIEDVSWLAETWSREGNDYTFTLFADAKFHDGTPLTTEDVAFTLDYCKAHPPVTNTLGAGDKFIVDHYTIVDERTITITVAKPTADTLSNLGSFVILPKHIWETVEDPYTYTGDGYLVGSGAYMCTSYDGATGSYEFTAFPDWCNGQQAAQRVLFVPVSDALLAFENGEIDITSMPADLEDTYRANPSIGFVEKTNDSGYKLLINFEKCPQFLDLELRKAIYWALDRQSIVDNVFRGNGSVGSAGYVPEGSQFYNENVVKYAYDPEKAKEALSTLGAEVTLLISDGAKDISIAEIVKNNLEAAGMKVQVESFDSATRDDRVNSGEYEFAIVGNGGWGNNPPTYMRTIFSDVSKNKGGNPHSMGPIGYSNEAITKLAEDQMYELDFEARKQMFKDLELLVSQEIPVIILANESSYSMFNKEYYDGWMKTYSYQQTEQNRMSYMAR